jgi:non-specific serine/threonine protein kinase
MSPEQARGEALDARTDLFSFGAVLYEMSTGRPAFGGTASGAIFDRILNREPAPPSRLDGEFPVELKRILAKLFEKDRRMRYQSASEVRTDLHRLRPDREPGGAAAAGAAAASVAVLYLEDLSSIAEDDYFRDGITEDIIIELSKIQNMRVFPRSAVLPFRNKSTPAPQVGQQLGASHVLEGGVRRSGNRLRITAQLVETGKGHSVWAERYDRRMEDVFAIQAEISQSIAQALRVVLSPAEKRAIQKIQTTDVEAYDFYLRGRQFFHQFRRKSFEFARQMYDRAIQVDPGYARAYAGLADCCSSLYSYCEASQANLEQADRASRRARNSTRSLRRRMYRGGSRCPSTRRTRKRCGSSRQRFISIRICSRLIIFMDGWHFPRVKGRKLWNCSSRLREWGRRITKHRR